jgi:hypothetical protein
VFVAASADRRLQQRLALNIRHRRERSEHGADIVSLRHGAVDVPSGRQRFRELGDGGVGERPQGRIAHDPLKPRPDLGNDGSALEGHPGRQQAVLERIICQVGRQEPAAGGRQLTPVAIDERLECTLVTVAREFDEPRVALPREKRWPMQR